MYTTMTNIQITLIGMILIMVPEIIPALKQNCVFGHALCRNDASAPACFRGSR